MSRTARRFLRVVSATAAGVILAAGPLGAQELPRAAPTPVHGTGEITFGLETIAAGALSSDAVSPLWLHANRGGRYLDERGQLHAATVARLSVPLSGVWRVAGELAVQVTSAEETGAQLPVGYGGVYAGPFALEAGRVPFTLGETALPALSSGSMSISTNAVPLPRVTGRTLGFVAVPGLRDRVETSFGMSHGWFGSDRYTRNALLHEKWLYLRVRGEGLALYGGLVHHAMWGGTNDAGSTAPATFENFLRAFSGASGGEDASESDQINKVGNSLGIWDLGFRFDFAPFILSGYYQHYFELASSFRRWANGLDGLKGLALEIDHPWPVVPRGIVFERMRTDYQGGPLHDVDGTLLFGRQSYYTNGAYRSGWTYGGRVLGTPLILASGEGEDVRIVSNRLESTHIGVAGALLPRLEYRFFWTAVAHRDPPYVQQPLDLDGDAWQYDLLLELIASEPVEGLPLTVTVGGALSAGDLNELAFGGLVEVRYRFR